MMRLDKYLAERTGMTRSESRKAVTKGRVSIDGAVCRKADTQLDEHTAAVALDGVPLAGAYRKFVYIMLNKPEGVVSASRDKKDTTVVDLVAADFPRRELFPAGRLDKTSTGFVLLTDDGALAHDILPCPPRREAVRSHAGHAADRRDAPGLCRGRHADRRRDDGSRGRRAADRRRPDRAGHAAAGCLSSDQADVRRV